MEVINIETTAMTPAILFDAEKGVFQISGRSLPENALLFYKPLVQWFLDYAQAPNDSTTFCVRLDYFNSASAKYLITMFKAMEEMHEIGKEVLIKWEFIDGDEDIEETGREFKKMLKTPVELVRLNE